MITIRHIQANRATAYVLTQRLGSSPKINYNRWLEDQGASFRQDIDGTCWLDFADEKDYTIFALRWL